MPRPKVRTKALRSSVLDVTRALLEAEGEAACTTRRIAALAGTSPPALYEFFGDKRGLLRALFFDGFRQLAMRFEALPESDDARRDLEAMVAAFRAFAQEHPALSARMFSISFDTLDATRSEREAGARVRRFIVAAVKRGIEAGVVRGDPTDVAHGLLGLAMGLATQERAGWLGSSEASIARRWRAATQAMLDGLAP